MHTSKAGDAHPPMHTLRSRRRIPHLQQPSFRELGYDAVAAAVAVVDDYCCGDVVVGGYGVGFVVVVGAGGVVVVAVVVAVLGLEKRRTQSWVVTDKLSYNQANAFCLEIDKENIPSQPPVSAFISKV